ncbi:hypothetical protein [Flavilitoribacter nigricans]|uniref:Uncharacterized protein n=1 Tax=Flavilitoribacter nigricans (strain ATCC 23147 / DSM 23189 / NBRC 102662 / NCIMB 1420 / SS-2) TaxID=1122177 RepID=A0A2D0ND36_FLAN2|nr:hypothetical protein [Flavilitoribacter nigricans]PHN06412.1 hypothetical protein CRP01_12650 [Flavilitoribacter nigricans DSM 23189 = NBRC 102662]
MKTNLSFLILLISTICLFLNQDVQAQRIGKYKDRIDEYRRENWPPERNYSRISLGYALQRIFKKHTDYCGFTISDNKRDYVPGDLSKFLGRRDLRTKVETANIRGGGMLYYIFNPDDIEKPFDEINFMSTRVFQSSSVSDPFEMNPDENFDSFILTKNCSGYLKAFLDAGIEPPYFAFKKALETDGKRESTVVALSGSFISPMKTLLEANDWRTTEAMMNLWQFYRNNAGMINQAYYLREFEGVMVKHLSTAEDNFKIEAEVGMNVNLPLAAKIKGNVGVGRTNSTAFSGTDWETIIYADFAGRYTKQSLFSRLPSPTDIKHYFQAIKPTFQQARDFPLMTEGAEHTHYLTVEGVPPNMTNNFWVLDDVLSGVYDGQPTLTAEPFQDEDGTFGCRFIVRGRPLSSNFSGPLAYRPGKLGVAYTIRSRYPVGGEYISIKVNEEIQTSAHPIAILSQGEFDLKKREDRRFAFQWKFVINLEDEANPVDLNLKPFINNLVARRSDSKVDILLTGVEPDPQRRRYYVTVESLDTYPLEKIDDTNMVNYNLSMDVHLQSKRSAARSIRPVKGILSFPSIKPDPAPKQEAKAGEPISIPLAPTIESGKTLDPNHPILIPNPNGKQEGGN